MEPEPEPKPERTAVHEPGNDEMLAALEFCATAPLDHVQRSLKLAAAIVDRHQRDESRNAKSNAEAEAPPADWEQRALAALETVAEAPYETKSMLASLAPAIALATIRNEREEATGAEGNPAGRTTGKRRKPPGRPTRTPAEPAGGVLPTLKFLLMAPQATARRARAVCAWIAEQRERQAGEHQDARKAGAGQSAQKLEETPQ